MSEEAILLPDWDAFERDYVATGIPHLFVVRPSPGAAVFLDSGAARIGVRFEEAGSPGEVSPAALAEIHADKVTRDGRQYLEIWTDARHLFGNFYRLVSEIMSAVVEEGSDARAALAAAVARWEALLSRTALMSDEAQAGLFGELWLLERLIAASGADAVEAWVGPNGEAHDFRLGEVELEVKTTSGATRVHMINGLGQLQPSIGCSLYLLSLKTANAGSGGRSLPEAVAAVEGLLATATTRLQQFRSLLAGLGYDQADAHLYPRRRRLRDAAVLVPVADGVPRLTPEAIAEISARFVPERIGRVSYSIDVEGLGFADGTPAFAAVLPNSTGAQNV